MDFPSLQNQIKEKYTQFLFKQIPESPPKSKLLFHYTDAHGLYGITSTGTLWATKLQFLNDRKEFKHAVDMTKKILANRKSKEDVTEDEEFLYSFFDTRVDYMDGSNTFICSFSEKPDLLSQWRAYGGSGGFNIGFQYDKILKFAHNQSFRLMKCIYDKRQQEKLIISLIDDIKEIFLRNPKENRDPINLEKLINLFYSMFLLMASTMKHPSFHEESEWRLIGGPFSYESPNLRFRPTKTMLLPYYEFNLNTDSSYAIENIYVGPNNNRELAIQSTSLYIRSRKKDWKIQYSDSPYRMGH